MQDEQITQVPTNEPATAPGVMETPITIDPVVPATEPQGEPTPAVSEPAPTTTSATPATPVTKTYEEKLLDYMHGRSDEDPDLDATTAKPEEPEPAKAPAQQTVVKPAAQTQPQTPAPKLVKDYTGLTPDETHMFKNMSNEAYAKIRPIFDQHKKITEREAQLKQREESVAKALPKGIFDHEAAYTLSPQYNQLSSTVQKLDFERSYWAKQFAAVEKGEDYKPLLIDANGRYVEGKPVKASADAKAEIMNNMTLATQLHTQHNQQLQSVQQSFAQRRSELVSGIKAYENKLFGFLETPDNPYKPVVQEVLQAIPEEFRDHPLAPLLAKAMATIRAQSDVNTKLAKQTALKQTAASDARRAGPTMTRTNAAVSGTRPVSAETDFANMTPDQIIASFKQR